MAETVEHLTELLSMKNDEIAELRGRIDRMEREKEDGVQEDAWVWTRHHIYQYGGNDLCLPVPRLELRWKTSDEMSYNSSCWYLLVFRHLTGSLVEVPLGLTTVSGKSDDIAYSQNANRTEKKYLRTPFRDGAHISNESRQLGLPAFVTWKDKVCEIVPHKDKGYDVKPIPADKYMTAS